MFSIYVRIILKVQILIDMRSVDDCLGAVRELKVVDGACDGVLTGLSAGLRPGVDELRLEPQSTVEIVDNTIGSGALELIHQFA